MVAKDQETVVIGGIMQERIIESTSSSVLGDIPLLGYLFRETSRHKIKTNLLLFLTPYIIRDASDFRRIFEKKMAERQRFVEEFYGQVPGYDVPIDFGRKPGPLAKMNQIVLREEMRIENGGPGLPGEQLFRPGQLGPGAPRQPSQGSTAPADVGRDLLQSGQPAPAPAPAPAGPLGPGGTPTPQAAPAPAPAPGAATPTAPPSDSTQQPPSQTQPPPPADERIQVQPR